MKKLILLFTFVALLVCQSCNNKNEAQKNFDSIETVKETLNGEPCYLSADGKCLVVFLDAETVEIDIINSEGELDELFKSDVIITTDSNDNIVLKFGDRAEFTPEKLTIYGGSTYTNFNQYTPQEIMDKGIHL